MNTSMIRRSRCCEQPLTLYKRDDLTSDLVSHFRRLVAEAKTPADANYPRISLASLLWWNDDKEEAIAEITKVAETSKPESDLRLDLAELLEQQGDRALALATTESVQPLDNTRMKRREELALRLSVLNGRPRACPAGGGAALRPAAGYRHAGSPGRANAPAWPA